ncbi:MAG: hypothetical protein ABJP70_10720 [Erythrobacter sp.]
MPVHSMERGNKSISDKPTQHTIDAFSFSPSGGALDLILSSAVSVTQCRTVVILAELDGYDEILAHTGLSGALQRGRVPHTPEEVELRRQYQEIKDARLHPAFDRSTHVHGQLAFRYIVTCPIVVSGSNVRLSLVCADRKPNIINHDYMQCSVQLLSKLAAEVFELQLVLADQNERFDLIRGHLQDYTDKMVDRQEAIVFLDRKWRMFKPSKGFLSSYGLKDFPEGKIRLDEYFPDDQSQIASALARMESEVQSSIVLKVTCPVSGGECTLIITYFAVADPDQPAYMCMLRSETSQLESLRVREPSEPSRKSQIRQDLFEPKAVLSEPHEEAFVTAKFLLDTTIEQTKLHSRKGVTFHTVRRWRSSIKEYQVRALRALKRRPSDMLIESAANELAAASNKLFGARENIVIASVACGNSGENCLAKLIAIQLAKKLKVEYLDAFECIETTGSSHPRRNSDRGKMKLRQSTNKPVLLIDDVATSGAHIHEAVRLLSKDAPSVVSLAWIGG